VAGLTGLAGMKACEENAIDLKCAVSGVLMGVTGRARTVAGIRRGSEGEIRS